MKASHGDYRRHDRTGLKLPVSITWSKDTVQTSTLNVSRGGISLAIPDAIQPQINQVVSLVFHRLNQLAVDAQVVNIDEHHLGLRLYHATLSENEIENLIHSAPILQRLGVILRRTFWMQSRRLAVLATNTLLRPLLLAWVKPRFLFAAYGTRKDVSTYFTPMMERLLPPMIICGLIRNQGKHGFLIASKYLEGELSQDTNKVRDYLSRLRSDFPTARRIALVGRLPNFTLRAGIALEKPFVDGSMGTRYMIWDVARQMHMKEGFRQEIGITVLGGAGRIGNLVCEDLLRLFPIVIAFDTRYSEEEIIQSELGTIIRTGQPRRLKEHKLFIGLTHHGDAIRDLADALPPGGLIADDTHPCISLSTREILAQKNIRTLKIVLSHEHFTLSPRMPSWNERDIPGCLVEALVLLDHGDETTVNFDSFRHAALQAGFEGRLIEPLDE